WVFKGSNVYHDALTDKYYALVALSDGGKDAVVNREFDLDAKAFVDGGFVTPEAKQRISWEDKDTLLIGTDWGEGTLTESGYPFIVKRWKRGTALESAEEIMRGDREDVSLVSYRLELDSERAVSILREADTFFTATQYLLDGTEVTQLPLPKKCGINGVYQGWFLISLEEEWQPIPEQEAFQSGDLVAVPADDFFETCQVNSAHLVFRPNESQAVNGVAISKHTAILSLNDTVVSRLVRIEPSADGGLWKQTDIALPGKNGRASVIFADRDEEEIFLAYEGFLTPDSLLNYDVESNSTSVLKSLPEKFDASGLTVKQAFATSTDGTKIPYFIVHRSDIELDGSTPTLLYAYGGFQISMRPSYSATVGKLWLEKGGAYAVANIRGGGEFGPNWHQAGLKTKRQIVYDDFISVGEALVKDGVTKPEHLGIMGGSNGGLLMGVMLNQRPDLWNAVIVQVPLLDMLRYHLLLAGASWVDEYGSPDVPEERAFLEQISPVHNFAADKPYPTPLFVTSTKDDRVHPGHARKMAKLFQDADLPFYYYENIDGGHSAAANQIERAKRTALEFTYLHERLFP
ncbi:MAG: prolyl oligopeptidase family serine peptidase, partial [Verrucomicrobiota bacterium]